jgi:hypothetical protein
MAIAKPVPDEVSFSALFLESFGAATIKRVIYTGGGGTFV